MALASSVQLTPKAPGVISNATVAGAFMFFLADGTAGTIANGIFKKDSAGVVTPLLPNSSVSNAMQADMVAASVKGRAAGAGTGPPTDLTGAQVGDIVSPAWSSFTPTLTQGVTVTKTIGYAKYTQIGKTVIFSLALAITSSGTAGSPVLVGLPVAAAGGSCPGYGTLTDTSAGQRYQAIGNFSGASAFGLIPTNLTLNVFLGTAGSGFTAALASGDEITACGQYEVV